MVHPKSVVSDSPVSLLLWKGMTSFPNGIRYPVCDVLGRKAQGSGWMVTIPLGCFFSPTDPLYPKSID